MAANIKKNVSRITQLTFLLIVAFSIVAPLLIMVFGSFKDPLEVTAFNMALPKKWHFENYLEVISQGKLVLAFFNSLFITAVAVLITIFITSMASFILARKKTKLSTFLYFFFFIGSLAPMQIIPTINIFQKMHLYGGYVNAILIYCTINIAFSCFLYTGYIKGIPKALDEAAMIEGASLFKIFFSILFPLLKPINITLLILIFMGIWNDISIPIYFLTDPQKWTMPLSVYQFFGKYQGSNWNLVFSDLVLTALPVVILYLFAQKYIVAGLTSGAVKQ